MTAVVDEPVPTWELDAAIGERIHQQLWRRRMSQAAFARALKMDPQKLSRKLRGDTRWTPDDLMVVSEALDVSFDWLFGVTKDPRPAVPDGDLAGAPSGTRTPDPLINDPFGGFYDDADDDGEAAYALPMNVTWLHFGDRPTPPTGDAAA